MIYLIGSLRNIYVPLVAKTLREAGFDIFDEWHSAGPDADDCLRNYGLARGLSYAETLAGAAATNIFEFDFRHLSRARSAVMVLPAGKSAHLELGVMIGWGKPCYILLEPDRPVGRLDVMHKFASGVFSTIDALISALKEDHRGLRRA